MWAHLAMLSEAQKFKGHCTRVGVRGREPDVTVPKSHPGLSVLTTRATKMDKQKRSKDLEDHCVLGDFCWRCYAVDSRQEGSGPVCSSAAYGSPSSRDTHIPRIWKRKEDDRMTWCVSQRHERVSEVNNERSEFAQGRVLEHLTL